MPQSHTLWPTITQRPESDPRQAAIVRAVRAGPQPISGASNADSFGLAALHLECAVMLRVAQFKKSGGPTQFDRGAVRSFVQDICTYGDDLLYGGPQCAQTMDKLVEAVAVLSFQPGGVSCAGLRFESE